MAYSDKLINHLKNLKMLVLWIKIVNKSERDWLEYPLCDVMNLNC